MYESPGVADPSYYEAFWERADWLIIPHGPSWHLLLITEPAPPSVQIKQALNVLIKQITIYQHIHIFIIYIYIYMYTSIVMHMIQTFSYFVQTLHSTHESNYSGLRLDGVCWDLLLSFSIFSASWRKCLTTSDDKPSILLGAYTDITDIHTILQLSQLVHMSMGLDFLLNNDVSFSLAESAALLTLWESLFIAADEWAWSVLPPPVYTILGISSKVQKETSCQTVPTRKHPAPRPACFFG